MADPIGWDPEDTIVHYDPTAQAIVFSKYSTGEVIRRFDLKPIPPLRERIWNFITALFKR